MVVGVYKLRNIVQSNDFFAGSTAFLPIIQKSLDSYIAVVKPFCLMYTLHFKEKRSSCTMASCGPLPVKAL